MLGYFCFLFVLFQFISCHYCPMAMLFIDLKASTVKLCKNTRPIIVFIFKIFNFISKISLIAAQKSSIILLKIRSVLISAPVFNFMNRWLNVKHISFFLYYAFFTLLWNFRLLFRDNKRFFCDILFKTVSFFSFCLFF